MWKRTKPEARIVSAVSKYRRNDKSALSDDDKVALLRFYHDYEFETAAEIERKRSVYRAHNLMVERRDTLRKRVENFNKMGAQVTEPLLSELRFVDDAVNNSQVVRPMITDAYIAILAEFARNRIREEKRRNRISLYFSAAIAFLTLVLALAAVAALVSGQPSQPTFKFYRCFPTLLA